jgi:hypothetical protein
MRRVLRFRPSPAIIVASIALVAAMGGTGYAAFDNQKDNPKKTAAKFYDTQGWLPGDSRIGYQGIFIGSRICTSSPYTEGNAGFTQRFDLPDGAKITKVTFYYFDYNPSAQLDFSMAVSVPGLGDDLGIPHATSTTTTPPTGNQNPSDIVQSVDITPSPPLVVDNAGHSYGASAEFQPCNQDGSSPNILAVDGVRVQFRLP